MWVISIAYGEHLNKIHIFSFFTVDLPKSKSFLMNTKSIFLLALKWKQPERRLRLNPDWYPVSKLKKKQRQNVLLNVVGFWISIPSHPSYTIEIPRDEFSILFVNNIRLGWWGLGSTWHCPFGCVKHLLAAFCLARGYLRLFFKEFSAALQQPLWQV